jgi:hypothetical protein
MRNRIKIVIADKSRYGVRLYAVVPSRSATGGHAHDHTVVYIRKAGMRRWLCDCKSQLFIQTGKRRNCEHIRQVREIVEAR